MYQTAVVGAPKERPVAGVADAGEYPRGGQIRVLRHVDRDQTGIVWQSCSEDFADDVTGDGGGSLEDLISFNSESVARAIVACPVPVVSGVGHEVDVTISDLAADVRVSTPSAAAAFVLPDRSALAATLSRDWRRLENSARGCLREARQRLGRERDALRVLAPTARLASQRVRLQTAMRGLARGVRSGVERRRSALSLQAGRLESLSPLAVLARGYAMVQRQRDGLIVRRREEAPAGERRRIRVAEGEIEAVAEPGDSGEGRR